MIIGRPKQNLKIFQNKFPIGIDLKKGESYLMAEGLFMQVKKKMKRDVFTKFEKLYKPLPNGTKIKDGDKLLVWRTGGIGDILFITTLLNHIKKVCPNSIIKFGCAKQYQDMIDNLDFIDRIIDLPLHIAHLKTCTWSIMFENVIENNPLAEKINCYELMAKQFNIDFKDVERKYPVIKVKKESRKKINKWLKKNHLQDKKLILIHQRASSPIRTPTVYYSSGMVKELTRAFPDYHFLIVDMPAKGDIVERYVKKYLDGYHNRVTNVSSTLESLSITTALVERASCVIGVDSSLIHLSAALETPAIGLYGPFKSDLRVKYYPTVIGLDARYPCAPCFTHGHDHCDEAKKKNGGIGSPCFDNIKYEEIVESIKKLIK